jgi:hypothetical protein
MRRTFPGRGRPDRAGDRELYLSKSWTGDLGRCAENFLASKGLTGLDEHQARRWTSWYRWATLAMHGRRTRGSTLPSGEAPRGSVYVPARLGQCATQLRADRAELDPLTTIPNVVDFPAAIEPS